MFLPFFSVPFYLRTAQAIDPIVKPLGFRRQGRFYHRIVGKVVQQFCLLWLNCDFTIRFHLSSVYGANDKTVEGEDAAILIDGSHMWLGDLMDVHPQQRSYLRKCTDTCVDVLTNHLLPWFECSIDSVSAYEMTKEIGIARTIFQEPDACESLGFLLDMERWEQSAALVKYYIDNSHLFRQKWWEPLEQEYGELYASLANRDMAYLNQYKDRKKAQTYRLFRYKQ